MNIAMRIVAHRTGAQLNPQHLRSGLHRWQIDAAARTGIGRRRIEQHRRTLDPGAMSRNSSSHLLPMLASKLVKPVMIPPGRAKLSTKPVPIGSETAVNTIGIQGAACRTAFAAGVE
jgi:hypothetical protein